jgi:hypothetical protein
MNGALGTIGSFRMADNPGVGRFRDMKDRLPNLGEPEKGD